MLSDRRVDYCPCWRSALSECPSGYSWGEKYLRTVSSERENMAVTPAASSQSTRLTHNATWLTLIAAERFEPNDTEAYTRKKLRLGVAQLCVQEEKAKRIRGGGGLCFDLHVTFVFLLWAHTCYIFTSHTGTSLGNPSSFSNTKMCTRHAHTHTHTLVVPTSSFNFCFSNTEEETVKRNKWKKMMTTVWPQINNERQIKGCQLEIGHRLHQNDTERWTESSGV